MWAWITWGYKVHLLTLQRDLSARYMYMQGEGSRNGVGGEKVTVCFSAGGVRGVDVYSDDWSRGDGPTQE